MFAMTKEDIQSRIDAKKAELKQLQANHNQLVASHNKAVDNFNAQAAANQTTGCKIQGAIDELTALLASAPVATSTTDSPPTTGD